MHEKQYQVEHWTTASAVADYEKQGPMVVTVNDRAATRQAIINSLRGSGVNFVNRWQWHARKPTPPADQPDWNYSKIAIHHAGRSYSCGRGMNQIHDVDALHRAAGSGDIGYHYAIDCRGDIYEGRDIRVKGAHLYHQNTGVIGIVFLENLSEPEDNSDHVSTALKMLKKMNMISTPQIPHSQISNAKTLIKTLTGFFEITKLGGHSEYADQAHGEGRSCPGRHGLRLASELRAWAKLESP